MFTPFRANHPKGKECRKVFLDVASSRQRGMNRCVDLSRCVSEKPFFLGSRKGLDGVCQKPRSWRDFFERYSARDVWGKIVRKSELVYRRIRRLVRRITPDLAPQKALSVSLVVGVAFGVVSMGFIEHFFGPGVFARSSEAEVRENVPSEPASLEIPVQSTGGYDAASDVFLEYFSEAAQEEYEKGVRELVAGYPIEEMLPYILEKDRLVAAFLIGIAKKESNWGKRVPVLDGQDCFNYWGYRGVRRMMGSGGHTCFNSRKDAVDTVTKRLEKLIYSEQLNTPEKLIVWKCGFSCAGHSRESVKKWISDVDMYFERLNEE